MAMALNPGDKAPDFHATAVGGAYGEGREVALGSVYASLERLQEKDLVTSQLGEATAERGGRAKRYFRLTDGGLAAVRETQRSLVNLWSGLPELEGGTA